MALLPPLSLKFMKKLIPINTTDDGCAFAIVTRYEGRCYLKSMTSGGGVLPRYWSPGVVGYINSSQDGAICHRNGIVPCLTSGHGNCPKVIVYEDSGAEVGTD